MNTIKVGQKKIGNDQAETTIKRPLQFDNSSLQYQELYIDYLQKISKI